MGCTICNQRSCNCAVNNTTINSEQAGRSGLSAKEITIATGKLRPNATDAEFVDFNKGDKGDKGAPGGDGNDGIDGNSYIPMFVNDFSNINT